MTLTPKCDISRLRLSENAMTADFEHEYALNPGRAVRPWSEKCLRKISVLKKKKMHNAFGIKLNHK